jgi:hypothetical protein
VGAFEGTFERALDEFKEGSIEYMEDSLTTFQDLIDEAKEFLAAKNSTVAQ